MNFLELAQKKLEGTKSAQTSISSVATICVTVFLSIAMICFVVNPSATESFLSGAPDWISNILESLNIGDEASSTFDIGAIFDEIADIDLPSLSIFIPGCSVSVFSINLIAGILFIALMALSCFFAPISSLTSILVNVFGWIASFRIIDIYKLLVNSGSTSWEASGSCFWTLVILYTILLFNGIIGFSGVLAKNDDGKIDIMEFCICVIVSALISFIFAIFLNFFNWLIMGLGWSGCIFIGMILISIIVILLEIFDLYASKQS